MYFRVCFPSGIFYGSEAYNPSLAEWPPHPSRLFSAMVASAYRSSDGINEQKIKALKWLETLPPPEIRVPYAETLIAPVSYVPPNDNAQKNKKEHGIKRNRQARHFPQAIIMDKPEVYYQWAEDPPNDEILSILDDMSFDVTHVGTSHSMAVVKPYAGEMPFSATLIPSKTGDQYLRVPSEGRLDELDVIFENKTGVRRPPSSCDPFIPYRKKRSIKTHQSNSDFLTLRISDSMHGADTAYYVGKALRAAVLSVLGDEAPACVHGHNNDQHIGWLPLPEVGHKYSKGRIIGFGISIPWEVSSEEKEKILSGIGRLKDLKLPDGRVASITQIMPGEKTPVSLSKKTWTKPSKVWASVTPVILDRAPKKLTEKWVVKAIKQSFVFAGYPEPGNITPSKFSIFDGAPPIFQIPIKKPRYHAVVEFENPLSGPVVAGRMRYFGIGLFRPVYPS